MESPHNSQKQTCVCVYVKNIFCLILFQDEADELELALTLSVYETKQTKPDHQPHVPPCYKSYADMTTVTSGVDQPNVNDGAVVAENQVVAKWTLDT